MAKATLSVAPSAKLVPNNLSTHPKYCSTIPPIPAEILEDKDLSPNISSAFPSPFLNPFIPSRISTAAATIPANFKRFIPRPAN